MTDHQSSNLSQLSALQRAALAVTELRGKLDAIEQQQTEPIAIIGMGCRFPGGVSDLETFWQLLREGVDATQEIPDDRWNIDAYYDPNPEIPGKMATRRGGFLECIDQFDTDFFDISPREAMNTDPQQRLLLEVSWEALEQAGIVPDRRLGTQNGVFVGISLNEYSQSLLSDQYRDIDVYTATGNALSVAAGRLAYHLGWQGPALAIDTACSSSLVSVHLACQSLRSRECNLALAGGVYLMLSPHTTIAMTKLKALSSDGRCKTFDATADGYGRGEGCGMVLLKRLSDAIADRDPILATIRGSAVNQDGRSSGLTVPNGSAQETVIRAALMNAKIGPDQIGYVETHGTGTPLGDPVEIRALNAVFGKRPGVPPLNIGSVKTNVGHLEAAAGIISLIKVVQMLRYREIPAHLNFKTLNPHIQEIQPDLRIPTISTSWDVPDLENTDPHRFAGVSSFGFSGTNAHVILEEFIVEKSPSATHNLLQLFTLSAKSRIALKEIADRWANYLLKHSDLRLVDVCFTANIGRSQFEHRLAVVVKSIDELQNTLQAFAKDQNDARASLIFSSDSTLHQISHLEAGNRLHDLAQRYVMGASIDWDTFDWNDSPQRIPLPTYPFQRQRYWLETSVQESSTNAFSPLSHGWQSHHPLLGYQLSSPLSIVQFQSQLCLNTLPLVQDHKIAEIPVLNLVLYLELVFAAIQQLNLKSDIAGFAPVQYKDVPPPKAGEHPAVLNCHENHYNLRVCQVEIPQALKFSNQNHITIQIILDLTQSEAKSFQIFSLQPDNNGLQTEWMLHIQGMLEIQEKLEAKPLKIHPLQLQISYEEKLSPSEFYQQVNAQNAQLGQQCQLLTQIWRRDGQAFGKVYCPDNLPDGSYIQNSYLLPLAGIDAALQLLFATLPSQFLQGYIIVGFEKFQTFDTQLKRVDYWAQASIQLEGIEVDQSSKQPETLSGQVQLFDDTGKLLIEILNIQLKRFNPKLWQACDREHDQTDIRLDNFGRVDQPFVSDLSIDRLLTASLSDRQVLLEKYLIQVMAHVLRLSPEKINSQQNLATLVDSLMAFELRNRILKDLQINLPFDHFFGENSISNLATHLSESLIMTTLLEPPLTLNSIEQEDAEEMEEIVL